MRCYTTGLVETKKGLLGVCIIRDDRWEMRCTRGAIGAVRLAALHPVSEDLASSVLSVVAGRHQKIKSQTTNNEHNTPVATHTILAVLRLSLAFFNSLFPLPRFSSVI